MALVAAQRRRTRRGRERVRRRQSVQRTDNHVRQLPRTLTPSSIGDFQKCPKLYEYRYIDKRFSDSPEMFRGTVVHKVLERLLAENPPQERSFKKAGEIAKQEILASRDKLRQLLGNLDETEMDVSEKAWAGDVIAAIAQYFKMEDPRTQVADWKHELRLEAPLSDNTNVLSTVAGKLDRVDKVTLPDSQDVVTIVDYKTGNLPPFMTDSEWQQLAIYAMVLDMKGHTWSTVRGRLLYLGNKSGDQTKDFTPADLERASKTVYEVREQILDLWKSGAGFTPRTSPLCDWCNFKAECPAFAPVKEPATAPAPQRVGEVQLPAVLDVPVAPPPPVERKLQKVNGNIFAPMMNGTFKPIYSPIASNIANGASKSMFTKEASLTRTGRVKKAFEVEEDDGEPLGGITVVRTKEDAERVLQVLMTLREPDRFHAIDTEVVGWKTTQTPYGHARMVCFSVFCGPDVDFGSGPRLWVDTGVEADTAEMVECFREYLEDPGLKKVFHNYSFDCAVFKNAGVSVAGFAGDTIHLARLWDAELEKYSLQFLSEELLPKKWHKSQAFADLVGEEGGDFLDMLKSPTRRRAALEYSTIDPAATWKLHQVLVAKLRAVPWEDLLTTHAPGETMLDFYDTTWRPLAEVLVDMECHGIYLDASHLESQEELATEEKGTYRQGFTDWVQAFYRKHWPEDEDLWQGIVKMNMGSPAQLRQLLFGGLFGEEKKLSGVRIRSLGLPDGLCKEKTKTGAPSLGKETLRSLCGRDPWSGPKGCGKAKPYIGQDGCMALASLCKAKSTDKAISSFLQPLQKHADAAGRIHTSLNLRTATGRMSSSSPNLQQQPALENDGYEIRKAFRAPPGCRLIVADYAQLELRVLAHLTSCPALIAALSSDGDIHSQTATDMYEHIRKAIADGKVVLEGGDGSVPTVKEVFAKERRHAKTLNFGIMYGMQAQGLSKKLECSTQEAQETINKWFASRAAVRKWQTEVVEEAQRTGYVKTLRGRTRPIDAINDHGWRRFEATRQAINTPAQGGAADIVVEAMLKLHANAELRSLGYRIVLQVHDELILEGPEEHAQRALELVREDMEHPFLDGSKFKVPLPVDVHVVSTWAEAKG